MTFDEFIAVALSNPANHAIVHEIGALGLPDGWLAGGCLVQTVWNALTGRPLNHGINDYDVLYFDPDTSWEAEDAIIGRIERRLKRDGIRLNRHRALASCLSMIFSENRYTLFRIML